jgi:hypothetical protein
MLRPALLALALAAAAPSALAGECEDNFKKSGNAFTGVDFSSVVVVSDLSVADAIGQMRGIMIGEKMDVLAEDVENGTLLVEQRSTNTARPIPTLINVFDEGGAAAVEMTVKTEKGQFAKQENIRSYMCTLLAKVQGGAAGRAAAAKGAATQNVDDVTEQDVYVFSRRIAREGQANAAAVVARHTGRRYALKGKVTSIQQVDGDTIVGFDIPETSEAFIKLPGDTAPRTGVACVFKPNQQALVLTFRRGETARFEGRFAEYDNILHQVWLDGCKQARRR